MAALAIFSAVDLVPALFFDDDALLLLAFAIVVLPRDGAKDTSDS
jgi:hypothetical protein